MKRSLRENLWSAKFKPLVQQSREHVKAYKQFLHMCRGMVGKDPMHGDPVLTKKLQQMLDSIHEMKKKIGDKLYETRDRSHTKTMTEDHTRREIQDFLSSSKLVRSLFVEETVVPNLAKIKVFLNDDDPFKKPKYGKVRHCNGYNPRTRKRKRKLGINKSEDGDMPRKQIIVNDDVFTIPRRQRRNRSNRKERECDMSETRQLQRYVKSRQPDIFSFPGVCLAM